MALVKETVVPSVTVSMKRNAAVNLTGGTTISLSGKRMVFSRDWPQTFCWGSLEIISTVPSKRSVKQHALRDVTSSYQGYLIIFVVDKPAVESRDLSNLAPSVGPHWWLSASLQGKIVLLAYVATSSF